MQNNLKKFFNQLITKFRYLSVEDYLAYEEKSFSSGLLNNYNSQF